MVLDQRRDVRDLRLLLPAVFMIHRFMLIRFLDKPANRYNVAA